MKTEAASLKWSEVDSACISAPANPREKIFQITYSHSFPCCPVKEHTVPLSQSITPGMQEAGLKLWDPGLSRAGDSLEKEKTLGLFLPHFSHFSERMCLCFSVAEGKLRVGQQQPIGFDAQQKELGVFPWLLQVLETQHCLLGHHMDTLHIQSHFHK